MTEKINDLNELMEKLWGQGSPQELEFFKPVPFDLFLTMIRAGKTVRVQS